MPQNLEFPDKAPDGKPIQLQVTIAQYEERWQIVVVGFVAIVLAGVAFCVGSQIENNSIRERLLRLEKIVGVDEIGRRK